MLVYPGRLDVHHKLLSRFEAFSLHLYMRFGFLIAYAQTPLLNAHAAHLTGKRSAILGLSFFCCFTSQVNSYGHGGTVSSPNHIFSWANFNKRLTSASRTGAGQNIPGQNIPCHFLTPRTKHPTKICHPGQNIPCCFCRPGHNIPCSFCHPGHNIPCHFCHPGQNIPHSDCSFRVSH